MRFGLVDRNVNVLVHDVQNLELLTLDEKELIDAGGVICKAAHIGRIHLHGNIAVALGDGGYEIVGIAGAVANDVLHAVLQHVEKLNMDSWQKILVVMSVITSVFMICSIKSNNNWIALIGSLFLIFLCAKKEKHNTVLMALPISVYMIREFIWFGNTQFKYFSMYKGYYKALIIIFFILDIALIIAYWAAVLGKTTNKKGILRFILTALAINAYGTAYNAMTKSLPFRDSAYLLSNIFFMATYILIIVAYGQDDLTDPNLHLQKPHPYLRFGGFLKAQYVIGWLGVIGAIILQIVSLVAIFKAISLLNRYGGKTSFLQVLTILLTFAVIVMILLEIKYLNMIKNKDQQFLWYFHKLAVAINVILFITSWASSGLKFGQFISVKYSYFVILALMIYLNTIYFTKSVRVRTYMQSDEYMKVDPWTKNMPVPLPADSEETI